MRAPLLKRRLNPFLLATTVLILSLLAALSVLYQGQLSELLSEKQDLSDNLEQKNREISVLKAENSNLSQELQDRERDIETYLNENEALNSQINNLNSTIDRLKGDVEELEQENLELNESLQDVNSTLGIICGEESNNITDGDEFCSRHGHDYRGN